MSWQTLPQSNCRYNYSRHRIALVWRAPWSKSKTWPGGSASSSGPTDGERCGSRLFEETSHQPPRVDFIFEFGVWLANRASKQSQYTTRLSPHTHSPLVPRLPASRVFPSLETGNWKREIPSACALPHHELTAGSSFPEHCHAA
ncbi:hypothetical protein CMEL01_00906 [Colletotrichum melonis]|uniref:Uncharacterized protein n=1 Tax=Colletotrichum melonis TaxID=1209925 RepID=A0AAI9Y1P0_9PEZI|nr:hypothetical protein CMEL01_00906 [Colletotrichum melonis]